MKIGKEQLGLILITLLFLLALYAKYSPQELSLTHSFPTTTQSSDAIFHALETEWIAEDEIQMHMAPYLATGKTDVYDAAPPQLYIGAAFFTKFAGIESYDSIYLLAALMFAASAMGIYLLLSKFFGWQAGLFSSLLIIFPLSSAFFFLTSIGWYHQTVSIVFFAAVPYLLFKALEKNRMADWALVALGISASALAHTIEGGMLLAFVFGVIFLETISTKKFHLKNYSVLLLPALILLQQIWATKYMLGGVGNLFQGSIPAGFSPGLPPVAYTTVHWLTILLSILGIGALFFSWKKKQIRYLGLWFLIFFLGFYSNWVGMAFWFERIRYTSYLLFYPLAGIGIYFLTKFIDKKYRTYVWIGAIILVLVFAMPINRPQLYDDHQRLMNDDLYAGLLWLKDNTPEDATVFFFDGYWQGTAAYCRRLGTDLRPTDMEKLAQPGLIEFWEYTTFGYHQKLPYKTGIFSFDNHEPLKGINLCEMDYKIFVNYEQLTPVLTKYQNKLAETNEVVYNQNGIVIMKDVDGQAGCLS